MFKAANRPARRLGAGASQQTQKRREERQPLQKSGSICFIGSNATMSCTLRDLHSRGARLSLISAEGIPDEFFLKSRQEGIDTRCRVAWRRGNEIGVRFLSY